MIITNSNQLSILMNRLLLDYCTRIYKISNKNYSVIEFESSYKKRKLPLNNYRISFTLRLSELNYKDFVDGYESGFMFNSFIEDLATFGEGQNLTDAPEYRFIGEYTVDYESDGEIYVVSFDAVRKINPCPGEIIKFKGNINTLLSLLSGKNTTDTYSMEADFNMINNLNFTIYLNNFLNGER